MRYIHAAEFNQRRENGTRNLRGSLIFNHIICQQLQIELDCQGLCILFIPFSKQTIENINEILPTLFQKSVRRRVQVLDEKHNFLAELSEGGLELGLVLCCFDVLA
jgi:hypothetical protein